MPIDVSGGDTTATATGTGTGAGGDGGQVSIYADADSDIAGGVSRVTNTADINLNGGVVFGLGESAGDGGEFYLGSYHGSDNSGAVTANGGSGGQYGGSGGSFYLESQIGVSNNTGAVAANGGEGTEDGGQGGVYSEVDSKRVLGRRGSNLSGRPILKRECALLTKARGKRSTKSQIHAADTERAGPKTRPAPSIAFD